MAGPLDIDKAKALATKVLGDKAKIPDPEVDMDKVIKGITDALRKFFVATIDLEAKLGGWKTRGRATRMP